ncbi:MAG TPA: sucrase ferredoxin [Pyrinomonadaceae bacterium]|jgi:hypothetical protein
MSQQFFYCSALSREAAEKTFGTASVGQVWLLIEYPYGWGFEALPDSGLSPAVKSYLNKFLKTTPRSRVLFIKQERKESSERSVFVVRCRERNPSVAHLKISDYEQLPDIDVASIAAGELPASVSSSDAPLYLVCTHGRRDKCCAKFGYPLYKSLRAESASVWQSSHVGGDRFAANLVCFPHGLFYAHVTEEMSRKVIREYEARRVLLDKYRGRACYSYPVQAAEYFVRKEAGITGLDELRQLGCERVHEKTWRARFMTGDGERIHEAMIRSVMSDFQSYTTCHSTQEKNVVQYVLDDYRVSNVHQEA